MKLSRAIACLVVILLLISCSCWAEDEIPLTSARSQTVRVLLTRLHVTDRLDLTLASPYRAQTAAGTEITLKAGSEISVLLESSGMTLYSGGVSVSCGDRLRLNRAGAGETETGFRKTNFPALYLGDLTLFVKDGILQPVLAINVEDYLLGVVPYEMSDSFPVEALKAQAVAARTYALNRQNSNAEFDLYDTTADQVFYGYLEGSSNAERAVRETQGVCGFYQGKLAMCYYAASNGGQTETVASVWPNREDLPYYTSEMDPYDVENPASSLQTYELAKKPAVEASLALRTLLAEELTEELEARGFVASPECIRLDEVLSVAVDTPTREGSLQMTRLTMKVRISGRALLSTPVPASGISSQATATETGVSTPAPQETGSLDQGGSEAMYGPFTEIPETFTVAIDIFPTGENVFGLNISGNTSNEIWSVQETSDAFLLQARRFGHGVGMSQRGAQWMALTYGKNYREILKFYYPGMELMRYPEEKTVYAEPVEDPGPAITPTPRPTLMPVSATPGPGQYYASVEGIADDSSLNLRASPSQNGEILMRLYKHQRLLVLEECSEEGWVKVCTDSAVGYVMQKFLTAE